MVMMMRGRRCIAHSVKVLTCRVSDDLKTSTLSKIYIYLYKVGGSYQSGKLLNLSEIKLVGGIVCGSFR